MRNISSERYGHVIPTTGFSPWCERQNLPHDVENEMFPTINAYLQEPNVWSIKINCFLHIFCQSTAHQHPFSPILPAKIPQN